MVSKLPHVKGLRLAWKQANSFGQRLFWAVQYLSLVQILANFAYFLFVKGLGEGLRLARRRASKDRSIEGKLAEVVDRLSLLMITMMMRMVLMMMRMVIMIIKIVMKVIKSCL